MKKNLLSTAALVSIISLFFFATSQVQISRITSDLNGTYIETSSGDSVTTLGSIQLLQDLDNIITAKFPDFEPLNKQIKFTSEGMFRQELEPANVHLSFIWLGADVVTDVNNSESISSNKRIAGYKVYQENFGEFEKIPVYEDISETEPVKKKYVSKEVTSADYELGLKRHLIEIGPEMYSYRYHEPDVMEYEGVFYGAALGYTYRGWVPDSPNEPLLKDRYLMRTEFRFAYGQADYDGSLSNGTPYNISDVDFDVFETRLMLGLDQLDKNWLASLYTGFGYRYSTDDTSFDPYGYKRESNYMYIPVVYQLDGKFKNNWAWGGKIEVDFLAWGLQKSHLSDVGSIDIENDQERGYGLRSSLRFRNQTEAGFMTIEPFIRYRNIEDSEVKYGFYEPNNNTVEFGLQLLWRF